MIFDILFNKITNIININIYKWDVQQIQLKMKKIKIN